MAWNKGDVITQREQFFANTGDQILVISTGKVGATYRPLKEYIPYPGDFLWFIEKYNMARCVPRAVNDSECLVPNSDHIILHQPTIRKEGIGRGKARHLTGLRQTLKPELIIFVGPFDWHLQLLPENVGSGAMVQVCMREDNFFHAGIHFFYSGQNALNLTTRVHYRGPTCLHTCDDGAVLLVRRYRNDCTLDGHKT